MSERVVPGPVPDGGGIREAVCIHTKKIYDSCRDKDCIEDLRVYPTQASQAVLERAVSVRGGRAELLNSQTLYLADKEDFKALPLKGFRLLFTDETAKKCLAVAREYLGLTPPRPPKNFTRGLYSRDVE